MMRMSMIQRFFTRIRSIHIPSIQDLLTTRSGQSFLMKAGSYFLLVVMAIVMILPLLWLVNGSFQPGWQINAEPVIWIPQEWLSVQAGNTPRELYLWKMQDSAGNEKQVVQIGLRRYTATVDLSKRISVQKARRNDLSNAVPQSINGVQVNVREWHSPDGVRQVVALARDSGNEDNLIVVDVQSAQNAFALYPLDEVNKAKLASIQTGGITFSGRQMKDGKQVLAVGPEAEMWIVGNPTVAQQASLIQADRLGNKELMSIGQTQLSIYAVQDTPPDQRYVVLVQENWQPLIEQKFLADNAFIAKESQLGPQKKTLINGLYMTVRKYTPSGAGKPYDVIILTPGSTEYLVMSTQYSDKLFAAPISDLIESGSASRGAISYRVQEDLDVNGKITPSALVGDIQDMALIIPSTAIENAQDVSPTALQRATRPHLTLNGYIKVLSLKLAGTPFWRFFANSGYVVLMNTIGHLLSCTLVAYGFARIRAPGRNVLFVVLLGTMMVPGTIITLPTYIVFRDLHLLGTMVPLWVRSFFGNAFLIFVMRQFFMTIPYDLDEAAILDGANRFTILTRIILPLSKSALAMVGIFTFWWYWNAFLDPLIYISDQSQFTITLAMNSFNQQYSRAAGYYDRILAGSVLSLLPMVLIFLFAQRYFIEGIQMQGLKR